jgi:hypothetical protein
MLTVYYGTSQNERVITEVKECLSVSASEENEKDVLIISAHTIGYWYAIAAVNPGMQVH